MSYEEVVFNRSYVNILLLNRSIPSMHIDDDKDGGNSNAPRRQRNPERPRVQKNNFRNESELFASLM